MIREQKQSIRTFYLAKVGLGSRRNGSLLEVPSTAVGSYANLCVVDLI